MIKHFCKTASDALSSLKWTLLPPLMLAADFIAVLTVSILVLWLIVVMPVRALAQEPQQPAASETASDAETGIPQVIHAKSLRRMSATRDAAHRSNCGPSART